MRPCHRECLGRYKEEQHGLTLGLRMLYLQQKNLGGFKHISIMFVKAREECLDIIEK